MVCNVDGECFNADTMNFSILRNAFNFVLPKPLAEAKKACQKVIGGAYAPAVL
jgi:hypothetical protein